MKKLNIKACGDKNHEKKLKKQLFTDILQNSCY